MTTFNVQEMHLNRKKENNKNIHACEEILHVSNFKLFAQTREQ